MDGAHTHHHGPGGAGIGTALLIGAALAVKTQVMNAVAAIVHALLIGLACTAVLALAASTIAIRRRHHAVRHRARQSTPAWLLPAPEDVEPPGDREVVSRGRPSPNCTPSSPPPVPPWTLLSASVGTSICISTA